ncbi:hypothetical protein DD829_13075 [Chryseobacterium sp. HMWF035]|nr:hypothetical protein DBR25_09000 [Chryseobacterium sp. HMWF001]PVV55779.1 hypothetical protein DD829_13075 [Chryseobacterium sp. HMWF035]
MIKMEIHSHIYHLLSETPLQTKTAFNNFKETFVPIMFKKKPLRTFKQLRKIKNLQANRRISLKNN